MGSSLASSRKRSRSTRDSEIGAGEERKCRICNRRLFKDLGDLKAELERSAVAKLDQVREAHGFAQKHVGFADSKNAPRRNTCVEHAGGGGRGRIMSDFAPSEYEPSEASSEASSVMGVAIDIDADYVGEE